MNPDIYNPRKWSPLTWAAVLLWAWFGFHRNYPPSEIYPVDDRLKITGEPIPLPDFASFDFPWGWPISYVVPQTYVRLAPVTLVGTAVPRLPSKFRVRALVANLILIALAIVSLVILLQTKLRRFSLSALFGFMAAAAILIAGSTLLSTILYFSPVALLLVSMDAKWRSRRRERTIHCAGDAESGESARDKLS